MELSPSEFYFHFSPRFLCSQSQTKFADTSWLQLNYYCKIPSMSIIFKLSILLVYYHSNEVFHREWHFL